MSFAPIALFVYNRPEHTRRTLEALRACPELVHSPLFIYCDGAKRPEAAAAVAETRKVVRALAPSATIVERTSNLGLARSIIGGVSELCERFGKVIVVEDDLEVSPRFLEFLNAGLDRYADDERVMQVSGYQFPLDPPLETPSLFLSFSTSWGWATWSRAWRYFDPDSRGHARLAADPALRRRFDLDGSYPYFEMLERQRRGEVDSWAIRWQLSVFLRDGLVLFPGRSLVNNTGFDGSGTHGTRGRFGDVVSDEKASLRLPAEVALDDASQRRVFAFLAANRRPVARRALDRVASLSKSMLAGGPMQLPRQLWSKIRHLRARRGLDACGPNTRLHGITDKRHPASKITVGRDCFIEGRLVTETASSVIDVGSNVYISGGTLLAASERITIEDDVLISYECIVTDSDNHSLRYSLRKNDLHDWQAGIHDWSKVSTAPVRICKGAWLGARVIVVKGVTIGEGAVCGMGSVVTRDVAPYTIVAGNPARVVKELGPDEH